MKKILFSIVAIVTAFLIIPKVNALEKVPVYIFTKNGCPACESAFEYFDNLEKEHPDLFEQYIIETFDGEWNITDNGIYNLLIQSLERLDGDTEKLATPTIFIGDYLTVGLPNNREEVYEAIEAASKASEKVDIVKDEAKELKIDLAPYKKVKEEAGKYDAIIIIGIFIVLIGGFTALIVLGKK